MTNPAPYQPPRSDEGTIQRTRIPIWLRIKRCIIGALGVAAMAWSVFAAYNVLLSFGFGGGWHMLLMTLVTFLLGAFALHIALRGSLRSIRDFNLIP